MPNPRANRPLTLDQVTADLKSLSQPAQALFDIMAGGLRGSAVGTLGAPGDIETLARMGVNAAGGSFNPAMPSRSGRPFQPISEEPYFPSSEELAKRFAPTIPNGDVMRQKTAEPFEAIMQFAPLPGSARVTKGALNAVKSIPAALKHGALEFAKASAMGAPHVVKPNASTSRVFEPNPDWKTNTVNFGKPTPGIMIPSKMSNVREAVRELKGNYGARRVERAADEIPNLERMYQEDALKEAFTGDNASAMITLNPAEFERYARELKGRTKADIGPKMAELARQGVIDKYTVPMDEYIKHLQRLQGGFRDVPNLNLFKDEVGLPTMPKVTGHEGRHRSRALAEQEAPSSLVQINPRGDLREGLPRRTQEEFIEALKEELGRSNRLVLPESDGPYKRPAVEFPEPYAEGGSVHISDNPETMKMELGDKHMRKGGSEDDTKPFVGYPHLAKQARYARAVTPESGDVNLLKDPQTYAYVMGLLGEAPDELGFTALNSDELKQKIKAAGEKGFVTGAVSQIGPVAQLAKKAGKKALNVTGQALSDAMIHQIGPLSQGPLSMLAPKAAVSHVVKPKGGNWLTGSVEEPLDRLLTKGVLGNKQIPYGSEFEAMRQKRIEELKRAAAEPGYTGGAAKVVEHLEKDLLENPREKEAALNKWIKGNLTNYIKKEMATPEDPVRKLAEEGIVHMPPEQMGLNRHYAGDSRRMMDGTKLAKSPEAEAWEDAADVAIGRTKVKNLLEVARLKGPHDPKTIEPWMEKADPETHLYFPQDSMHAHYLGFDHIIDVLKEDLATGRLTPDKLSKVSMEQAVRRTHEYDQELAKKMAEARISARADLPVHKEYPEGYKWVELNKPGSFAQESESMGHSVRGYEPPQGHSDWAEGSGGSGSQGYGHGGWEAIKSGKAKVYSLVDPKGEPHVTIEVGKPYLTRGFRNEPNAPTGEENTRLLEEYVRGQREGTIPSNITAAEYWRQKQGIAEPELPFEITQIKGKQNRAPKAEYLPYVQDFVRGGQWSDVGDLQNTGLAKLQEGSDLAKWLEQKNIQLPKYPTKKELDAHEADFLLEQLGEKDFNDLGLGFLKGEGMAAGGSPRYPTEQEREAMRKLRESFLPAAKDAERLKKLRDSMERSEQKKVSFSDNPDTMMMELEDKKYQVGGIVDAAARAAKAAKAAQMKKAMKASEALAQIEGKNLNITQADRTKVGEGLLGGPGFSGLQHQEGPHKEVGAVWGVKNPGTAKTMLGGLKDPLGKEYFTTMIGSPTQHQSNQMVFDKLYSKFKSEAKKGNLDPELQQKINERLASAVDKDGNPVFPPDVDILSKDFKKIANTFDRRSIAGNLIGGVGVGGRKGQIIDYDKIIRDTTDPFLLDMPSGSLGHRLWTPSGEIIERPDLHPAFPAIATGEDLGVEFTPASQDILMAPWIENVRKTKGRNPGYMDWTRGRPPSVQVTEDILRKLEESGNKEGGAIHVKKKSDLKHGRVIPLGKAQEVDISQLVPQMSAGGKLSKAALEAFERMKAMRPEIAAKASLEQKALLENANKYARDIQPFSMTPEEVSAEMKRLESKGLAGGGEVNADDLILEERPL